MLRWCEIRKNAIEFSKEWKNETKENAEAKTFWNEFFNIFGVNRRRIASFEEPVKKINNNIGFIDLFWKGTLIAEHKSKGKSLDKAYTQALEYFEGLKDSELPKYVVVSDFQKMRLYNLEDDEINEFRLTDLYKYIHLFSFIQGETKSTSNLAINDLNIKASKLMSKLHDCLKQNGYIGHKLEVLLIRLLFCLFADDTKIFEKRNFYNYIIKNTKEDGSDLGMYITMIFEVLDIPIEKRQKNISQDLMEFRYINGALFREKFEIPSFNKENRDLLVQCCNFKWGNISPAIFGSLFQYVMDLEKRSNLGAHYTSEENILKIINDLFLDELKKEFESSKNKEKMLYKLLMKIRKIKVLDPTCGCGNFLIVAYKELRLLEMEIYKRIVDITIEPTQIVMDIDAMYESINVDM